MSSQTIRRRTLGALAAATAVGALAVPATGVAGVAALQDDVLTTAPLASIPTRIDMVKQTKAKVTRIDILWSLVAPTPPANAADPNDPAYDWSRLDAIFTGLAAGRHHADREHVQHPGLGRRGPQHPARHDPLQPERAPPGAVRAVHAGGRDPLQRHLHPGGLHDHRCRGCGTTRSGTSRT